MRIKLFFVIIFMLQNTFGQKEIENVVTLRVDNSKSPVLIFEGDSTKFYNLYFGVWDSILSTKSTDDLDVYSKIKTLINYNPLRNVYNITWYTENGNLIQFIEVDSLSLGSGSYTYLFNETYVTGTLINGMKNGFEFEITKDLYSKKNFINGKAEGSMIIIYFKSLIVHEILYSSNKRTNYQYWYKYDHELLNLFDFCEVDKIHNGSNTIKKNKKTITFNFSEGNIQGDIIVKDRKNKTTFYGLSSIPSGIISN